uniref:Uncharacterized protein n=1 Tax=Arundo donax TaxID=35708 RepID=A0A0A9GI90_ARUDO
MLHPRPILQSFQQSMGKSIHQ